MTVIKYACLHLVNYHEIPDRAFGMLIRREIGRGQTVPDIAVRLGWSLAAVQRLSVAPPLPQCGGPTAACLSLGDVAGFKLRTARAFVLTKIYPALDEIGRSRWPELELSRRELASLIGSEESNLRRIRQCSGVTQNVPEGQK